MGVDWNRRGLILHNREDLNTGNNGWSIFFSYNILPVAFRINFGFRTTFCCFSMSRLMVLHTLLNLPAELLLEITACLYAQPISKDEFRSELLWPLSQTCRQMNACCDPWIFAKYHLCLQAESGRDHAHLTPLGAVDAHECCSLDVVKARLLHFRSNVAVRLILCRS